ncbi:hypothetical protein MAR_035708 [Mya arenaria]|uniref:EF-hand domain-containing protein n=1 Tax=Mya arenaria TaxID=6604 RepID=A0ABY7ENV0_MYAAR|nr:uncharacterized protein LOC128241665 [Mya arenaria]WAR10632.1 hypothetical protein MAR_035708 [Mya arenaria]
MHIGMSVSSMISTRTLILTVLLVTVVGRVIESNDSVEKQMEKDDDFTKPEESIRKYIGPTVHHFATHSLCNHNQGKVRFFKALRNHFHNISDAMKISFVLDLCKRRDQMLIKWVQEIFDKDGDGHITLFEKEIYR